MSSKRPEPFEAAFLREYDLQEIVGLNLSADKQSVCYLVIFEGRKDKSLRRKMLCSKKDMRMIDERFSKQHRLKFLCSYIKRCAGVE